MVKNDQQTHLFKKKMSEVHLEYDKRITLITDILLKNIKSFLFRYIKKKIIECFTVLITLQNIHIAMDKQGFS